MIDNPLCITSKEWQIVCERIRSCEDNLIVMKEDITEIKTMIKEMQTGFQTFRSDIGDIITKEKAQREEEDLKDRRRINKLENWRTGMTWAIAIVTFILGIVGKDLWDSYRNYPQAIQQQIQEAVQAELVK